MKKINIFSLLFLLVTLFTGCKEDHILFDIEQPQFELREGYMLLEIIAPWETGETDNIYIYGAFNGGMEEAVGNPLWKLEKGPGSSVQQAKWGIYLDPSTFMDGKTLADGYAFYNMQQGNERGEGNVDIVHKDYPNKGERLNVFVPFWEDHFLKDQNPDEIAHDGFVIYVLNNTSWDQLAMYAWNEDGAEPFGGWPGMLPTGKVSTGGITMEYFDTGAVNEGLGINLIFNNNNNGSQLGDYYVTLDKDYYLEITDSGVTEYDPDSVITHEGYVVYVYNNTDWTTVTLYMWGDVNDLNGGWPGMNPTGTEVVNGVAYLYFDMGEEATGLAENLIFSNAGDNQLADFAFTINRNIYLEISKGGVKEIDPDNFTPGDPNDVPTEPENPDVSKYNLYIENNTGWDTFYVYAYGAKETDYIFGAFPGAHPTETEIVNGVTYLVVEYAAGGEIVNLIFNDGQGTQYIAGTITADKDYYFQANPTSASQIEMAQYSIFVEDKTGWAELYLYGYGDAGNSYFGDWPGTKATTTETIDGTTYYVFDIDSNGKNENLIFNNNSGTQLKDFPVTFNQDYYLVVTAEGVSIKQ